MCLLGTCRWVILAIQRCTASLKPMTQGIVPGVRNGNLTSLSKHSSQVVHDWSGRRLCREQLVRLSLGRFTRRSYLLPLSGWYCTHPLPKNKTSNVQKKNIQKKTGGSDFRFLIRAFTCIQNIRSGIYGAVPAQQNSFSSLQKVVVSSTGRLRCHEY